MSVLLRGAMMTLPRLRRVPAVRRGRLTGQMQSWYQDLLEDRLTHCGRSLDAVFRLTADRSNPLVALKRSMRNVDRLEIARALSSCQGRFLGGVDRSRTGTTNILHWASV